MGSAGTENRNNVDDELALRIEATVQEHWRNYRRIFKRCRRHFSVRDVHRLRIESRRLMSLLDLLAPIADAKDAVKARRLFKAALRNSSELRDTQVQLETLKTDIHPVPGLRTIRDALRRRACKLERKVGRQMKQTRLKQLKKPVDGVLGSVRARCRRGELRKPASQLILMAVDRAFTSVVKRHRAIVPAQPGTIHRTRVVFKKFRYMLEALGEILPGSVSIRAKEMQACQARMGDIQDAAVFLARLDELEGHHKIDPHGIDALRSALRQIHSKRLASFIAEADGVLRFWPARQSVRPMASLNRSVATL